MAAGLKRCKRCHVWKPATLDEFGSSPKRKNLRMLDQCRDCRRYAADKHTEKLLDLKNNVPEERLAADLWVLPELPALASGEADLLAEGVCRGWGRQFQGLSPAAAKTVCATCPVTRECRLLGDMVESVLPVRASDARGWPVWAGETLNERLARRAAS